jgi:predicted transporter
MSESTKANYNFLLAIAFIGIGSWKVYQYFEGVEMETYRIVLAALLVGFGFFQLYRWWKARDKTPKS